MVFSTPHHYMEETQGQYCYFDWLQVAAKYPGRQNKLQTVRFQLYLKELNLCDPQKGLIPPSREKGYPHTADRETSGH